MSLRAILRCLLGALYAYAGYRHIASPDPFIRITPAWVPFREAVVFWTGIAELLSSAGLMQPWSPIARKAAGISLAIYAICVFPANLNHFAMDLARADHGWGLAYHIPRMFAQPLIVWLALWTGGVTDWPLRRRPV